MSPHVLKEKPKLLLAEALNECDEAQRRLSNLRKRIDGNARVYQNTRPTEDPQALLRQAIEVSERVRTLNLRSMPPR